MNHESSNFNFPARYEELLLQRRRIRDTLFSRTLDMNNSNIPNNMDSTKKEPSYSKIFSNLLENYIDMSTMLYCAVHVARDTRTHQDSHPQQKQQQQQSQTPRSKSRDLEAVEALYEQTMKQQFFDHDLEDVKYVDEHDDHSSTTKESLHSSQERNKSATTCMPFGQLCALAAIEQQQKRNLLKSGSESMLHASVCPTTLGTQEISVVEQNRKMDINRRSKYKDMDSIVDLFFEKYPECMRSDLSESTESEDENESSGKERKFKARVHTNTRTHDPNRSINTNNNRKDNSDEDEVEHETGKRLQDVSRVVETHPSKKDSVIVSQNNIPPPFSSNSSSATTHGRNDYTNHSTSLISSNASLYHNNNNNHHMKNYSYVDHDSNDITIQKNNKHRLNNSFQTAKEYAMNHSENGNNGDSFNRNNNTDMNHRISRKDPSSRLTPSSFDYNYQQHNHQQDGDTTNDDSWENRTRVNTDSFNTMHHSHVNEITNNDSHANINKPTLSAGLRRKFQLPKPRSHGTTAISNHNHTSINRSTTSGYGGGVTNSSSTSSTVIRNNTTSDARKNASDDSALPEELKGLDKDLISKIEMEIIDAGDPITFNDIAGLAEAKQTVIELVCWPMKRPDLFTGLRKGPNGLLLFGPPGTGKTLIGKAIAHESGATFFSISSSSLTSKWIGEGEKLVRTLFAVAGYREPSVVFIDEIDSLLTQRKADENEASRRIKTEFLVQLDGTGTSGRGRVLVVGATNRPQELDEAARRRFVKRLYIPLPAKDDRSVLLKTLLSKNSHRLSDLEIEKLSIDTDGFSGADLKALCTDAALGPIRQLGIRALEIDARDVPPISYHHFRQALRGMNPSVAQSDLKAYLDWNETYGSRKVSIGACEERLEDCIE